MHSLRRPSPLTRAAVWLALAGVVLRSLIPVGFMPGWIGAVPGAASWLVICPASELSQLAVVIPEPLLVPERQAAEAGHGGMAPMSAEEHVAMLAAMAAAHAGNNGRTDDGRADPHADHHAQHAHNAPAQSVADHDNPAVAGHAGHDRAAHHGHVIAAEHQNCPYAGAAVPAVPGMLAALQLPARCAPLQLAQRVAATTMHVAHRLPPPRGPPLHLSLNRR